MKNHLLLCLGLALLLSSCRRDTEDLGYDPNGTEFRFGYNNEAVRVKTFDPPRHIAAQPWSGSRQVFDSLDVDLDQIADIVLEASYGNVLNGLLCVYFSTANPI